MILSTLRAVCEQIDSSQVALAVERLVALGTRVRLQLGVYRRVLRQVPLQCRAFRHGSELRDVFSFENKSLHELLATQYQDTAML